ncbi:MAG: class I SAM-dependent methyltransferase [Spirochaetia bacterium]|nr:class I SAM-dependent methyltransferase [Spirochaetia bacterium]
MRQALRQVVLQREGKDFLDFFHTGIRELIRETGSFTREEKEIHGYFFRKQVWHYILCSRLLTRTNLKPRGYVGDHEMLRMIYENRPEGADLFSQLMHLYPLTTAAAEAVRRRRVAIPGLLAEHRRRTKGAGPTDVLSVACGPALEVAGFFEDPADAGKIRITLLDQDEEALTAAKKNITQSENNLGRNLSVRYIQKSVRTLLREEDASPEQGRFDFIYSMGLFDYLTPPVAKAVFAKLFRMLKPGGRLVVGNFHKANPDRVFMEYWCDWVLYYRSEEEFLEIASEVNPEGLRVFFLNQDCQMFLEAGAPC